VSNLRSLRGVLIAVAMVLVLAACALPPPAPITAPMATPAAAPTAEPPMTVAAISLPAAVAYNLGEATIVQERFPEDSRFRNMPVRLNGVSAAPLAFVTTSTAMRQGVSRERRRLLGILFFLALLTGAMLGYLALRNQPLEVRLILVALASGFLIITVIQGIIPEANREGEPRFAGVLSIVGLSLYALMSLALK